MDPLKKKNLFSQLRQSLYFTIINYYYYTFGWETNVQSTSNKRLSSFNFVFGLFRHNLIVSYLILERKSYGLLNKK